MFKCKIGSDDFKADWFYDDELDLPYFILHFCKLADAVIMDGENKGFIDIPVWRRERDNKPYNARIMENIYSLAYFYTTNRPWNPYFKDPKLKLRIEKALNFWCSIQNEEGQFSEYSEGGWNLPATAFATKFMGEALILLNKVGTIDENIISKADVALRNAIMFTLKEPEFFEHGRSYTNQFSNVWPGALAYLSIKEDKELDVQLRSRIIQSIEDFQSPAGYFYEADGPDWNYNLGTHENNLMMTWPYCLINNVLALFGKILIIQCWN